MKTGGFSKRDLQMAQGTALLNTGQRCYTWWCCLFLLVVFSALWSSALGQSCVLRFDIDPALSNFTISGQVTKPLPAPITGAEGQVVNASGECLTSQRSLCFLRIGGGGSFTFLISSHRRAPKVGLPGQFKHIKLVAFGCSLSLSLLRLSLSLSVMLFSQPAISIKLDLSCFGGGGLSQEWFQ
jgi:hypothetical protein